MDTLTDLAGSLIIKEVTPEDDGIRIEGDLLWRGYFEEGGGECLWEGAEYFSETIENAALRGADADLIEPKLMSLKGEAISDSTYRLTFDIRWFEEPESITAEPPAEEQKRAAEPLPLTTAEIIPRETEPPCARKTEPPKEKTELEEKLERIDETWRETVKVFQESDKEDRARAKEEAKPAEEEPKGCPYSNYCLRFYRTREGDELERIAEKFSATVAKLKEYNRLDTADLPTGRMLRIP